MIVDRPTNQCHIRRSAVVNDSFVKVFLLFFLECDNLAGTLSLIII
jgi:hypothetical protein